MKGLVISSFFALAIVLFGCGDDSPTDPTEVYSGYNSEAEQIQKGKVLFTSNCKVCHSFNVAEPTGMAPVLKDIDKNWPDKTQLVSYIKNAPEMMQSNEHTRDLYKDWKDKAQMPPFLGLSENEVNHIITYILQESK